MLQLNYKSFNLPFQYPFTISKGVKAHQPTLVVVLQFGKLIGVGEATAISYYNVTVENMKALLEEKRQAIEKYALISPERFWHFLHHLLPEQNFLIAALDIASWDIWAKLKSQPLWQLLGLEWKHVPPTDYTIGTFALDEIAERVKANPYPIYKLKVGSENDLPALQALRESTDAVIRIDANEGWSAETARYIYPYLEKFKVELIEQPLHRDDEEGLIRLKEIASIPIIADETCRDEKDLDNCLKWYDGINIKLSKCGGITPALRMIKKIKQHNKKIMIGGMCESYPGACALANLLPAADYADIDGPLLLKENVGKGLIYDHATIQMPLLLGTGFSF